MSPLSALCGAAGKPVAAVKQWLLAPIDGRVYRYVGASFALAAAAAWLELWPLRDALYAETGLFGTATSHGPGLNVFIWNNNSSWVTGWFLAALLGILGLAFGLMTRAAIGLVYLWMVSYSHTAPLALGGFDTVLRITAFVLLVSPAPGGSALLFDRSPGAEADRTAARFSVSRFLAQHARCSSWVTALREACERGATAHAPRYGLRLLQWQLMLIYASTVWLKAPDKYWRNGEVASYFGMSLFGRFPDPSFAHLGPLDGVLTYGTLLIEAAVPVLLWVRRSRWVGMTLGLSMHLGIAIVGKLELFSLSMLPLYLAFLENHDLSKRSPPSPELRARGIGPGDVPTGPSRRQELPSR